MQIEIFEGSKAVPFKLGADFKEIETIVGTKLKKQDTDEDVPNSRYYYAAELDIRFLFDGDQKLVLFEAFSKPKADRELLVEGVSINFKESCLRALEMKGFKLKTYLGGGYMIENLSIIVTLSEFKDQTASLLFSDKDYFDGYSIFPYEDVSLTG